MFGRRTRGLWICIAAAMLIAGSAFTAYADTTIANIRVTFKNNYDKEEGKILEPTVTTGSGYRWRIFPGARLWRNGIGFQNNGFGYTGSRQRESFCEFLLF